ncbi:helix-turn-helix domain-containing protein [Candidatus Dependentiae bacterium]|nr:helix-turn-helix domain-containing protein [Candidatus Dependentiae bacterium]
MSKFYRDLKAGLEEIIAYKEGKIELRSTLIELPEAPRAYSAHEIKDIREVSRYSQGIFAKVLNVSKKTVQSWESGQRVPSQAALRLLEIVDKGIYRPQLFKK